MCTKLEKKKPVKCHSITIYSMKDNRVFLNSGSLFELQFKQKKVEKSNQHIAQNDISDFVCKKLNL